MSTNKNTELSDRVKLRLTELVRLLNTPFRRDFAMGYLRLIIDEDGYIIAENAPNDRIGNPLEMRLIYAAIEDVVNTIYAPIVLSLPLTSDDPEVTKQAEEISHQVEDCLLDGLKWFASPTGTPELTAKGIKAVAWFKDGKITPPSGEDHSKDWQLMDFERPLQIFAETIGRVQTLARDAFPDPTEPDTTQSMLP